MSPKLGVTDTPKSQNPILEILEAGTRGFSGQPGLQSKALSKTNPVLVSEAGALAATAEALVPSLAPQNQHKERALRIRKFQPQNQTHA